MQNQPCFIMLQLELRLEFMETKVLSSTYPQYSLRVYEGDISEWPPRWPKIVKQAVKYEGYLCQKIVY